MASQHVKSVMLRNTINALPMRSARTPLPAWKHSRFQGSNSNSFRHTRAYQTLDYQTPAYKTPAGPPDGWGYTLFDCDHDLDIVDSISNEASELGIEHLDLMYPKDKKHVVERLNESLFHLLLHKFLYRESRDEVVYLGALAMRLGVRIRETEMRWLRESVGCVKMYDEAREQMWAALKGYNPEGGHPWKFSCMGPIETQWQGGVEGKDLGLQAKIFKQELSKMMMSILEEWKGETFANVTVREQSAKTILREMRWAIKKLKD